MKKFLKLVLVAAFVVTTIQASCADQCITQGDHLNKAHSLHSDSIDPYAFLLPDLGPADSLANTYDLKLNVRGLNNLNELQFETYDNRGVGAGYTSPYLWEVGQGPGYRSRFQMNRGASGASRFSPIPMPVRR